MRARKSFEFEPIGYVDSCFKEKFGIPRQSGLVTEARAIIKLRDEADFRTAVRSLDQFTHVWLVFVFHEHGSRNWKPSIRPPRLGGARKVGVLASRSPHRPNPIGLSAVKLERVDVEAKGGPEIHISGADLLDGTPILDLKPYIPYADSIADAGAGWAVEPIRRTAVEFSEEAEAAIATRSRGKGRERLRELIVETLALDPRPAFQKRREAEIPPEKSGTLHGFRLLDFDVKWQMRDGKFHVLDVVDFTVGKS